MSQLELFEMPSEIDYLLAGQQPEYPVVDDHAFDCLDCGRDTGAIGEYYMVADEVWLKAHPERWGHLCIGCLEDRLGRRLCASDFPAVPINDPHDPWHGHHSRRLLNRLGSRS